MLLEGVELGFVLVELGFVLVELFFIGDEMG